MKIFTLYDQRDLLMKQALDRYLVQLSRSGHTVWSIDLLLAGGNINEVLLEQLRDAGLVLLLTSQNFWDSQDCYDLALRALALSEEQPAKKIVPVLLRPNSIEDTPFKELRCLPAQDVYISRYADPEQGYWDVYQGLKIVLDPDYRYKKRPKIVRLKAFILSLYILLFGCLAVMAWSYLLPESGIRIVPRPCLNESNGSIYYRIYKLDDVAQKEVMFAFGVTPDDTFHYGHVLNISSVTKTDDGNWSYSHTEHYNTHNESSQCVQVDFGPGDAGEYRFKVYLSRPLIEGDLPAFERKLGYGDRLCGTSGSNVTAIKYFSFGDYFYLQRIRCGTLFIISLTIILLFAINFIVKKISTHA